MTRRRRLRRATASLWHGIVNKFTPNRSSRGGAKVIGSVIHTTESGEGSIWGIVNYFMRADVQVSSHYVEGDQQKKGSPWTTVVRMVPETEKAWTAKAANPHFVQYELVGRASRKRSEWLGKYRAQLETTAALVADDVLQYGFPIRHGIPGIVGHADLGAYGNDHWDPGPGFPWDVFLDDVRRFVQIADERPEAIAMTKGGAGGSQAPRTA
jgi:N-acetyl-anhydromuramyl-L-alanine amidase AmpD